jgi:signal peptidase I
MERQGDNYQLFPHSSNYQWNEDNFGPVWLPKKGATIELTEENLIFYKHTIEAYESSRIEVKDGKVFVNGKEASQYTFRMDYYWMMGDNRHSSSDSRFWGYVPEDHIIGKPKLIWLSVDKDKKFLKKIRFERMFRGIDAAV